MQNFFEVRLDELKSTLGHESCCCYFSSLGKYKRYIKWSLEIYGAAFLNLTFLESAFNETKQPFS